MQIIFGGNFMKESVTAFKGRLYFALIAVTILAVTVSGLYFGVALGRSTLIQSDESLREGDVSTSDGTSSPTVSDISSDMQSSEDSAAFSESSAVIGEAESSHTGTEIRDPEHGWVINSYGYTYLYNGHGYRQFSYGRAAFDRYINTVSQFCTRVNGSTRIFNLPAPISTTFADIPREIYVADNFFNHPQSSFVANTADELAGKAITVDIVGDIEKLLDSQRQVYYNTDSNWTPLAAFCAYEAYCAAAGFDALPFSAFGCSEYGEFLGDFYTATKSESLAENADRFYCLTPPPSVTTELNVYASGKMRSGYSLCGNSFSAGDPFGVYFGVKAARYEILSSAEGGKSLLVIGDTSCRPMIPLLAAHYSRIDYIDPVGFGEDLAEFAAKRTYDDILISMYTVNAVSGAEIPAFAQLIGGTENGK